MNTSPQIPVDFNNADEDGAVRLITPGTTEFLASHQIVLAEGLQILMTDGEIFAKGIVTRRRGFWVAAIVSVDS